MTPERQLDVPALLQRAVHGDLQALNPLLKHLLPRLLAAARRYILTLRRRLDVGDLVGQAWLRAQPALPQCRAATVEQFYSWMAAAVRSEALDARRHHRAARRDLGRETPLDAGGLRRDFVDDHHPPAGAASERRELTLRALELVERLPGGDGRVLRLWVRHHPNLRTVAAGLGARSIAAVRKRIRRALDRLPAVPAEDPSRPY